jgi:hypothetical protein
MKTCHRENWRETLAINPFPEPMIQGPNSNTKLVAGAADAGYRDCSVRSASREYSPGIKRASDSPSSAQHRENPNTSPCRAAQTRSTATALAVALRGKQNSSPTKYNLVGKRSTLMPNPSLKRSANGRPPGPGRWYSVHFHRPGPGGLPLSPA